MIIEVNANAIIDRLINEMEYIHERYQKIPRGTYIYEGSPYRPIYDKAHAAEQSIYTASDLLNMSVPALYGAALTARRWYNKTNWQICLPDSDADKLLQCMAAQYPNGR